MKRALGCHAVNDMTRYAIIKGLRPEIRAYVLQQTPTSMAALLEAAKIAEDTVAPQTTSLTECHAADDMTRYAIIKGLRPEIRAYVLQQAPTSTAALLEAAKIAEDTVAPPTTSLTEEVLEAIRRLETRSTASIEEQR